MKLRNGFVSNSSSSSFIVTFTEKPKTKEEVFKLLFNSQDGHIDYYDIDKMQFDKIAEIVFDDLQNKKLATLEDLTEEFFILIHAELCGIEYENHSDVDLFQFSLEHADTITPEMIEIIKQRKDLERLQHQEQSDFCKLHGLKDFYDKAKDKSVEKERIALLQKQCKNNYYNRLDTVIRKQAEVKAKQFIDDHKGWWYTILKYSDECGQGLLEHGGIFRHIEHIQVSHH